jgi:hypothetical protein
VRISPQHNHRTLLLQALWRKFDLVLRLQVTRLVAHDCEPVVEIHDLSAQKRGVNLSLPKLRKSVEAPRGEPSCAEREHSHGQNCYCARTCWPAPHRPLNEPVRQRSEKKTRPEH